MQRAFTEIDIEAEPQTVWSILDDLPRYPEWNPVVPTLEGRTTLGQILVGQLAFKGIPARPLSPRVNRVVPARQFRWITERPGDQWFTAEHIFELSSTERGTRLVHREIFDGPAAEGLADFVSQVVQPSYELFNLALKARAEAFATASLPLHPAVDHGVSKAASTPLRLQCSCDDAPVSVRVAEAVSHNHLCGCSRCWKPEGALFAQTAVVPRATCDDWRHQEKLAPVDPRAKILRMACSKCGVHMIGQVDDPDHHFYGLEFVHPELATEGETAAPEFAAFVSSLVESGTSAALMGAVRRQLSALAVPPFDAFSPEISDVIAYHHLKLRIP